MDEWIDGLPVECSLRECQRLRREGALLGTATASWNADTRKKAASKGQALPDGSFPIKDKADWHKAVKALGRAKNRAKAVRHIKKRARALGIPKSEWEHLKERV